MKGTIEDLASRYGQPKRITCRLPSVAFPPVSERKYGEVCMAILRPNGRFLLQTKRSYPDSVMRLPSGGIKAGEDVEHALLREVWEETNLTVTINRFVAVLRYHDETVRPSFRTHLFLLCEVDGELMSNDPTEKISDWCEVPPDELRTYAQKLSRLGPAWSNWGLFRAAALDALADHYDDANL